VARVSRLVTRPRRPSPGSEGDRFNVADRTAKSYAEPVTFFADGGCGAVRGVTSPGVGRHTRGGSRVGGGDERQRRIARGKVTARGYGAARRFFVTRKTLRRREILRCAQDDCDRKRQGQGRKKKQVPHPSALRAYGLRMTAKGNGNGEERSFAALRMTPIGSSKRPTLEKRGSGTRKGKSANA
jgi:hypothetical protein